MRGSSAIAASASAIAILEGEGTVKRFHQPKIRGSEPLDLRIEMNPETGIFKVLQGNCTDAATKSLSDQLLAFFNANPDKRFEMAEIASMFPGTDRKSLYQALNRLVKRGLISKRPSKINWRAKTWGLHQGSVTVSTTNQTPDIEKKNNSSTKDIAKKTRGLSPPIGRDRVSNENDETIATSEFPSFDTSFDTHSTLVRHDSECRTMESNQGGSFASFYTETPQKGGEGVSNDGNNEEETHHSSQGVTGINTHSTDSVNSQQSTVNSTQLVTDYSTYPHLTSNDIRACQNRASACKQQMLSCTNSEQLAAFRSEGGFSSNEIDWVYRNLLSRAQKDKVREAAHSVQLDLFESLADNSSDGPFVLEWDNVIAAIDFGA